MVFFFSRYLVWDDKVKVHTVPALVLTISFEEDTELTAPLTWTPLLLCAFFFVWIEDCEDEVEGLAWLVWAAPHPVTDTIMAVIKKNRFSGEKITMMLRRPPFRLGDQDP